ncbi:hypothetical protein AYI68_g3496 [Smittium mucronatum]|uniref:Uncharacterized protein n=1 Tax=Smittium mucronatum TaxID=133383 RepID=A0A1R0GZT0_9FUNG|nr:hypothetical protein AYI68_g3496 [Smittium mucronatum]
MRRLIIAPQETSITSLIRPSMDVSPIIEYFRELSDNEQLNIKRLTSKTCWLLAVCGFMHSSDIHRIDDAQTTTIDGTLKLVIVAPKKKHKGRQSLGLVKSAATLINSYVPSKHIGYIDQGLQKICAQPRKLTTTKL